MSLYADRGSPKFEKAALRWLERYLTEGEPSLERFAATVQSLARLGRTRRPTPAFMPHRA